MFDSITRWDNLWLAYRKAAAGKRGRAPAAGFEHQVADKLLDLQADLVNGSYTPGAYTHFVIHEPKRRLISAAPFRDRVVHHALVNVIEPLFEQRFIADSYANRVGKGTHRAIDRLQQFARQYRYVLRLDIVQHFPSLDHAILLDALARVIGEADVIRLVERIIASGAGVLADEYTMVYFPGDDLFAVNRPRGLPIGNLTSQFWSNCYMNMLDQFVVRDLRCKAYLRYVDDFALFSDSKAQLWHWKQALIEWLARLRLTVHLHEGQVMPCTVGIAWLGFVIYRTHRLLKRRNLVHFTRHFERVIDSYRREQISFAELDAAVQGWINHVRYGDTWGLRRTVFNAHPLNNFADRR